MANIILIVDDDPDVTRVLSDRLKAAGYETATAGNGREAVKLVEALDQALGGVLLDVQMPVMGGLETVRELGARFAHLPILMMSAISQPLIIDEAMRLGARGFVLKAVEPSVMLEQCRRAFGPPEG